MSLACSSASARGAVPFQVDDGGEGSLLACVSGAVATLRGAQVTLLRSARMSEPRWADTHTRTHIHTHKNNNKVFLDVYTAKREE